MFQSSKFTAAFVRSVYGRTQTLRRTNGGTILVDQARFQKILLRYVVGEKITCFDFFNQNFCRVKLGAEFLAIRLKVVFQWKRRKTEVMRRFLSDSLNRRTTSEFIFEETFDHSFN